MTAAEEASPAAFPATGSDGTAAGHSRNLPSDESVIGRSDPAAAVQLASSREPGDLQDEAVVAVLHQWAFKDPAAALEWAEAFSESALRYRALVEIANLRKLTAAAEGSE